MFDYQKHAPVSHNNGECLADIAMARTNTLIQPHRMHSSHLHGSKISNLAPVKAPHMCHLQDISTGE